MAYCNTHNFNYLSEHGCPGCLKASSDSAVALVAQRDEAVTERDILAVECDALRARVAEYAAFVRELTGENGPWLVAVSYMGAHLPNRHTCKACGWSWPGKAAEAHDDKCWRQRALAALGDQDGERARVEGGGR